MRTIKKNSETSNVEVGGYVNGLTGFGNMCFVLKMSEPVPPVGLKSNGGTRPRYLVGYFAPSFKIGKNAMVFSDFFKTS